MSRFESFRLNAVDRPFRFLATVVTLGLLLALNPQLASANSILTYTGNQFTSFPQSGPGKNPYEQPSLPPFHFVSATFEFGSDVAPNSNGIYTVRNVTINDGVQNYSHDGFEVDGFGQSQRDVFLHSDGSGSITGWGFTYMWQYGSLSDETAIIHSQGGCTSNGCAAYIDQGWRRTNFGVYEGIVEGNPGTWTSSTVAAIPEPETYAMLLAGLGLLGFAARRRKLKLAA